jgi:DNA-binding CsgD family transcriptional regulator
LHAKLDAIAHECASFRITQMGDVAGEMTAVPRDTLDTLIDAVYAAALAADQWPSVTRRLAHYLGAPSATAIIGATGSGEALWLGSTDGPDAKVSSDYANHFARIDPWAIAWRAHSDRGSGVWLGPSLCRTSEYVETEFYQDFARIIGHGHLIGACAEIPSGAGLMLAVHRPIPAGEFAPREKRLLERVMPHLGRAVHVLSLLSKTAIQRDEMLAAVDRLGLGAIVLGPDRRVTFASPVAERLLRSGEGLSMRAGRLVAPLPGRDALLQETLRRALALHVGEEADPGDPIHLSRPGKPPLSVVAVPIRAEPVVRTFTNAAAVVFVSEVGAARQNQTTGLAVSSGLTAAEARLLEALVSGERLATYADRVSISLNTANTHLKQIFSKTGTHRQSELIRLALNDLAAKMAGSEGA